MQLKDNLFSILFEQMLLESLWDTDETSNALDVPTDGGFAEDMVKTYELYYKWYELTTKRFTGVPVRKENILKQLQPQLLRAMNNVSGVLLHVFGEWLKSHAITKPRQWAIARLDDVAKSSGHDSFNEMVMDDNDTSELTALEGMVHEWYTYTNKKNYSYGAGPSSDRIRSMFFDAAVKNINNLPVFKEAVADNFIAMEKEDRTERLNQDGEGEYRQSYGLTDDQSVEDHIDNTSIEDIDIGEWLSMYGSDDQGLMRIIPRDKFANVLIELNEKMVFPVWYAKWKAEGIDTTRERVETAYLTLKNSGPDDINKYSASLNIALNTAHQTGSMLDHVDSYLSQNEDWDSSINLTKLLDQLSDLPSEIIARWDNELEEIGVET